MKKSKTTDTKYHGLFFENDRKTLNIKSKILSPLNINFKNYQDFISKGYVGTQEEFRLYLLYLDHSIYLIIGKELKKGKENFNKQFIEGEFYSTVFETCFYLTEYDRLKAKLDKHRSEMN